MEREDSTIQQSSIRHAVVLAVSSGTHASALTYSRPHTMLPALGKPLVVRVMDRLHRAGIKQYTVIMGEREGAIAAYLNAHWQSDVDVKFVLKPNGVQLADVLSDVARTHPEPLLVTSYDSFTHANFPERLIRHYRNGTSRSNLILSMAKSMLSKSSASYFATIDTHDHIEIFDQQDAAKRRYPLTNLVLCDEDFVTYLANGINPNASSFMEIVRGYLNDGHTASVVESGWTLQVRSDHDLYLLNRQLLEEGNDAHTLSEIPGSVRVIPPVRIDPQVSIGHGASIGPHVYLERDCTVGARASIRNTMVLQNTTIPADTTINNAIVYPRAQLDF